MAKKTKSKKKLKKLIARARTKKVQKIMTAVRIHKENTRKIQEANNVPNGKAPFNQGLANLMLDNKVKALRGKISSSHRRSRDRWLSK